MVHTVGKELIHDGADVTITDDTSHGDIKVTANKDILIHNGADVTTTDE